LRITIPFLLAVLGTTIFFGTSRAFFPAPPTGGNDNRSVPDRGGSPPTENSPPGGDTSHGGEIPIFPVDHGTGPHGGDGIPELDPGSIGSAFGLLISGALILTDRRRRK
jgi:hypothetical protein